MVEIVTRYKTFDGREFATEIKAQSHENDLNLVKRITDMFPSSDSLGMGEFYQLPLQLVQNARAALADILREKFGEYEQTAIDSFANGTHHGIIGRYLDDSNSSFYSVWNIFERIDDRGRMFNQPYYVHHPAEATDEISY